MLKRAKSREEEEKKTGRGLKMEYFEKGEGKGSIQENDRWGKRC